MALEFVVCSKNDRRPYKILTITLMNNFKIYIYIYIYGTTKLIK